MNDVFNGRLSSECPTIWETTDILSLNVPEKAWY